MGIHEFIGFDELTKDVWRCFVSEFVGTFIMVFVGTATVEVVGSMMDIASTTRIAFGFGFAIASVMKAHYHLSGGHLNPAITVSFMIAGQIRLMKAIIYMALQFIAAILASLLLKVITPYVIREQFTESAYGMTQLSQKTPPLKGLLLETILTFEVVLLVQGLFDPGRTEIKASKPLAIGIAVAGVHMAGVPWTGCSINPARSLGPAVIANNYKNLWVYFVGPFLGAVLAAVVYRFILKKPVEEEE